MIDFNVLVDEIEEKEAQTFIFQDFKVAFTTFFRPILEKIDDEKKLIKATTKMMRVVIQTQRDSILRSEQKRLNYIEYTDKPKGKIDARIKAANTILNSLEHSRTQPSKELIELLELYKHQTEKLYRKEFDEIFWSKSYRYNEQPTKQPLEECLNDIIQVYGIKVTQLTIKQAIDNTPLLINKP